MQFKAGLLHLGHPHVHSGIRGIHFVTSSVHEDLKGLNVKAKNMSAQVIHRASAPIAHIQKSKLMAYFTLFS